MNDQKDILPYSFLRFNTSISACIKQASPISTVSSISIFVNSNDLKPSKLLSCSVKEATLGQFEMRQLRPTLDFVFSEQYKRSIFIISKCGKLSITNTSIYSTMISYIVILCNWGRSRKRLALPNIIHTRYYHLFNMLKEVAHHLKYNNFQLREYIRWKVQALYAVIIITTKDKLLNVVWNIIKRLAIWNKIFLFRLQSIIYQIEWWRFYYEIAQWHCIYFINQLKMQKLLFACRSATNWNEFVGYCILLRERLGMSI